MCANKNHFFRDNPLFFASTMENFVTLFDKDSSWDDISMMSIPSTASMRLSTGLLTHIVDDHDKLVWQLGRDAATVGAKIYDRKVLIMQLEHDRLIKESEWN
jgi:hypothetical protein